MPESTSESSGECGGCEGSESNDNYESDGGNTRSNDGNNDSALETIVSNESDDNSNNGNSEGSSDDGNIIVYDDRLSENDIVEKVENNLDVGDRERYFAKELAALEKETGLSEREILYAKDWKEVVAVAKSVEYKGGKVYIKYKAISSYRFQAMKQGLVKQEGSQAYVNGVLITSDEKIVLGVRNSKFLNNLISVVPAGSLRADKSDDVLNNSFYSELEQELGVTGKDMDVIGLIGHQRFTKGEDTYVFTYGARTNLTFDQVKDMHPNAKDAQEHSRLLYLDNTLPAIETAVAELKDKMTPSTSGSLEILAEHKRNQGSDCGSCASSNTARTYANNVIVLPSYDERVFNWDRKAA